MAFLMMRTAKFLILPNLRGNQTQNTGLNVRSVPRLRLPPRLQPRRRLRQNRPCEIAFSEGRIFHLTTKPLSPGPQAQCPAPEASKRLR
jgi:hypothetical protein